MTATIADDLTETDRDKSCVCKDQGIANIDARLMGAMAALHYDWAIDNQY